MMGRLLPVIACLCVVAGCNDSLIFRSSSEQRFYDECVLVIAGKMDLLDLGYEERGKYVRLTQETCTYHAYLRRDPDCLLPPEVVRYEQATEFLGDQAPDPRAKLCDPD